ncbi:MAG: hypothetical protein OQK98_14290 [Gammaproteobacteria bacterium]|nr:hypothetical protein [Gammaproteobacteria bacterium]
MIKNRWWRHEINVGELATGYMIGQRMQVCSAVSWFTNSFRFNHFWKKVKHEACVLQNSLRKSKVYRFVNKLSS